MKALFTTGIGSNNTNAETDFKTFNSKETVGSSGLRLYLQLDFHLALPVRCPRDRQRNQ